MHIRLVSSMVMAGLLGALAVATMPALAEKPAATPARPATATTVTHPGLGEVRTFEVRTFEPQDYSSKRGEIPPEMSEYARSAVLNDARFRYASPGDGLLRFSCAGPFCRRVRAEVTLGEDGPVVWQTERLYRKVLTVADPDNRQFTRAIVDQLGADYEKSLKAVPMKIQIREE